MRDLAALLAELGLSRYAPAFAEHEVDLATLAHLSEADFASIGIPLGPRRRIMASLAAAPRQAAVGAAPASAAQTDRRPVTVLFADLAGFTALSRRLDAEELAGLMRAYFRRVDRIAVEHGGTVERHIGDCIMAVFGAPVARGNDTERAVAAAFAMAAAMPELSAEAGHPLAIHVGVASGQVVASRAGGEGEAPFTVTGETVNLASRLAEAAPAGEIYLSDRVRQALGERFDGAEIGKLDIQGFDQPVRAWRALGFREAASRRALVGRRLELAQLRAVLDLAREDKRGHVVHLRGEAGIGKTRLLEQLLADARGRGFACHAAHVLDFGTAAGQDAVGVLVRSLTGLARAGAQDGAADRLAARGQDGMFLMALAGVPHPPALTDAYGVLDAATREAGKRAAQRRLVERAGAAGPLALAFEDLHWADAATLSYLGEIVAATTASAALLVATSRPEIEPLDRLLRIGAAGASLTTIDLGPLGESDAKALAEHVFSGGADIIGRCIERANGNPLFLEQLLRHALEGEGASVPATVASLMQARFDRLSPPERRVLEAAAVLGQRFEAEALAGVLEEAGLALDGLAAQGILRQSGDELAFAHALIREAIYDSLLRSRRAQLHRKAADWFAGRDPPLRAAHLDRAGDAAAPRAYLEAAERCAAAFQYAAAQSLAARGLEIARADADRHALSCLAGSVQHSLGALAAALASYEGALAAAASDTERCRALIGCAGVKRMTDDLDGALRDLDAAQTLAQASGAKAEQARVHFLRGNLCFPRGDIAGCIREHEASLALARAAGDGEQEAAALGGLGDAQYMLGRMLSAQARFAECAQVASTRGFRGIEVANRPMLAFTLWFAGDARASASAAEEAVRLAQGIGHRRAEMIAHHGACFALHALTRYEASLAHADAALRLARELGAPRFEAEGLALRAKLLVATGRRGEALVEARAAVEIIRRAGPAFLGPVCLGVLAAATDDAHEAAAALDEADGLLAAGAVSHNHLLFPQDAIEHCLGRGDHERALRYARGLAAYASEEPLPWSSFYAERAQGLVQLARGERDGGLEARLAGLRADAERFGYLRDRP